VICSSGNNSGAPVISRASVISATCAQIVVQATACKCTQDLPAAPAVAGAAVAVVLREHRTNLLSSF
jgi:hypothetical protein